MAKGIVLYYSRSGSTKRMAESIADGLRSEIETDLRDITGFNPDELQNYQAVVIGSPTQYGSMAWEVKQFFDNTAGLHYKLDGKVGGAFSSSCHVGGGNETTVLDIIHALLIHGFIVQGEPMYDHYGAVSLVNPSQDNLNKCFRYGQRIGQLTKRLA